jgi:hypothetical protein
MPDPRRRILPAFVVFRFERGKTAISHSLSALCVGLTLSRIDGRGYPCQRGKLSINAFETNVDLRAATEFPGVKTNKPGLSREKPGLLRNRNQRLPPIGDGVKQTFQRLMVTTQPAVLEPEQLWQEQELPLERHILEGTKPTREHNTSGLLEHRLAHKPERTLLERRNLDPSVHRREHKLQREPHSSV